MPENISYPGVYIEEIPQRPKTIEGVPTSIAAFIGRTAKGTPNKAVRCLSYQNFVDAFGSAHTQSEIADSINLFFENGGRECYVVRLKDDAPDIGAALAALDDVDIINLLVIPPDVSEADRKKTLVAAAEYCSKRRSFLLIDAPRSWPKNVQSSVVDDFRGGFAAAESVAVFYPRIVLDGGKTSPVIGALGAIAGIIARTDAERGVWKASAGIEADLRGVIDLEITLTDAENGPLNQMGINCLRKFPTYGIVNWGARTLAGADSLGSEWKYIPVRRLSLYIEESVYRGTQWAVFEPNAEPLWANIRLIVNNFMYALWQQGALMGSKASEAYFVQCDQTTNTQDDVDNGRINIQIGFAAIKPAEFIIIRIRQAAMK